MNLVLELKKFVNNTLQICLWIIVLILLKYLNINKEYMIITYVLYILFILCNINTTTESFTEGE